MTAGTYARPHVGVGPIVGLTVSLVLHALVYMLASKHLSTGDRRQPAAEQRVIELTLLPPAPVRVSPEPKPKPEPAALAPDPPSVPVPRIRVPDDLLAAVPHTSGQPASMAAPPAPSAEEWAFAGRYTLKNSKAYRYTWGQQVRSMMGTAVEGPNQGMVRFRVEIAPDGSLARLETLWSTSPVAERLARQAIDSMPQWPATPTGKPLIFEKTISFTPHSVDGPPIYKDDCLPDPPAFVNPFAWDGKSPHVQVQARPPDKPDPQALEDCLKQLPQDSIEAESARDQRLMDQWGWRSGKLN